MVTVHRHKFMCVFGVAQGNNNLKKPDSNDCGEHKLCQRSLCAVIEEWANASQRIMFVWKCIPGT